MNLNDFLFGGKQTSIKVQLETLERENIELRKLLRESRVNAAQCQTRIDVLEKAIDSVLAIFEESR